MSRLMHAGSHVPAGTYRCDSCGHEIKLDQQLRLPDCPTCGGTTYEPPGREPRKQR